MEMEELSDEIEFPISPSTSQNQTTQEKETNNQQSKEDSHQQTREQTEKKTKFLEAWESLNEINNTEITDSIDKDDHKRKWYQKYQRTSQILTPIRKRRNSLTAWDVWDTRKLKSVEPLASPKNQKFEHSNRDSVDKYHEVGIEKTPKFSIIKKIFFFFDGTMPEFSDMTKDNIYLDFVPILLRGIGQVVFMNNPITGLLILVGLLFTSYWLTLCGFFGVLISSLMALLLELNREGIRGGLFGYNGFLCGLAISVFIAEEWSIFPLIAIFICSLFSTILTVAIGNLLVPPYGVPPFTLPFNFMTIIFLFGVFQCLL